jgi:hypothetical protein
MTEFSENGYVLVKGFLDKQSINTFSRYFEYKVNRHSETVTSDESSSIMCYADPLAEVILKNALPDVETASGLELYPTYSFTRVYQKGEELKPHVDRPSCEISVTCNIATIGKAWPIYMKATGKAPTMQILEPGDAVVYKGCEVTHWRDTAVDTEINVQLTLHYVDKNGPNSMYAFDERRSLGLGNRR